MPKATQRTLHVQPCPACGQSHEYKLDLKLRSQNSAVVFGGSTVAPQSEHWTVILECPKLGQKYSYEYLIESDLVGHVISVDQCATENNDSVSPLSDIFSWSAGSAEIGRKYAQGLLTVTAGMLPAHFAVVTYLSGTSRVSTPVACLTVAAAALLVLTMLALGHAVRPVLSHVTADTAEAFRNARLQSMARGLNAALWLFFAAMVVAVASWSTLVLSPTTIGE